MKLSLEIVKSHNACSGGLDWYTKNKEPKTVEACVKKLLADKKCSNNLDWANWLLSQMLGPDDKIRYAIFAAEQVLYLFEEKMPGDLRPRKAIEAAKEYLKIKTPSARAAARDAARAAGEAWAAGYAWAAAGAAGEAAREAREAGEAAREAGEAARDAGYAARSAGYAARYAGYAAWAAGDAGYAWEAAREAARAAGEAWAAAGAAGDAAGEAASKEMLTKIINYGISLIKGQK
jgi:hypothetical protein